MRIRRKSTIQSNVLKLLTLGLLIGVSLVLACEKTETLENETIDFISLKQLNNCPAIVMNTQLSDDFMVINTQEEFEQSIFIGDGNPQLCELLKEELTFDFAKHTLLIGKSKISHVQGELISEKIFRSGDNSYTYYIRIKNGGYTALGLFRFGVIIPKITYDAKVTLDIEIEERL